MTFAYVHIKQNKIFTYHEDFPDTIDGEKVTQKIKVFSLESFGVLYSFLEKKKKKKSKKREKEYIQKIHCHDNPHHKAIHFNGAPRTATTALSYFILQLNPNLKASEQL